MDIKVLHKLTYGLFLLCARENDKDNGCIINTVLQLSSNPLNIGYVVNKSNYTCEILKNKTTCSISILSQDADFELIKNFGFCSGRDTDKFKHFHDYKRLDNENVVLTKGLNSYLVLNIVQKIDLCSHILFIGLPVIAEVVSNAPSLTYDYYLSNIKPNAIKIEKNN